jgi:hypothetical protein
MFFIFQPKVPPHVKRCLNEKARCYPDFIQLSVSTGYFWCLLPFAIDDSIENRRFGRGKSCSRFMSLARINWRIVRCVASFLYLLLCAFSNSTRELLDVASQSWPLRKTTYKRTLLQELQFLSESEPMRHVYIAFFYSGKKAITFRQN